MKRTIASLALISVAGSLAAKNNEPQVPAAAKLAAISIPVVWIGTHQEAAKNVADQAAQMIKNISVHGIVEKTSTRATAAYNNFSGEQVARDTLKFLDEARMGVGEGISTFSLMSAVIYTLYVIGDKENNLQAKATTLAQGLTVCGLMWMLGDILKIPVNT